MDPNIVALLVELCGFGFCLLLFSMTLNWVLQTARSAIKKSHPIMKEDSFTKENGYSYEYVFVYKVLEEDDRQPLSVDQQKYSMKNVWERLMKAKFDCKCFYSCQRDEVVTQPLPLPLLLPLFLSLS